MERTAQSHRATQTLSQNGTLVVQLPQISSLNIALHCGSLGCVAMCRHATTKTKRNARLFPVTTITLAKNGKLFTCFATIFLLSYKPKILRRLLLLTRPLPLRKDDVFFSLCTSSLNMSFQISLILEAIAQRGSDQENIL